ncbi:MAG: hypothetical protein QM477_04345 [Planctomycetota bacterium]
MTDWLDEILDCDTPESVPEGFAARVVAAAQADGADVERDGRGRLISFPQLMSMTAAAVLLLSVGFWMGQGADAVHQPVAIGQGPENAMLNLDELYQNREVLEAFDILSDEALDSAFLDVESGTWALDYALEEEGK